MIFEITINYKGNRHADMVKLSKQEREGSQLVGLRKQGLVPYFLRDLQYLGLQQGGNSVGFQWNSAAVLISWDVEVDSPRHHKLQELLSGIYQRVSTEELSSRFIASLTLKEDGRPIRKKMLVERIRAREQALSPPNVPQPRPLSSILKNEPHMPAQAPLRSVLAPRSVNICIFSSGSENARANDTQKRKREDTENRQCDADGAAPKRMPKRVKFADAALDEDSFGPGAGRPLLAPPLVTLSHNDPLHAESSRVHHRGNLNDETPRLQADLKRVRAERDAARADVLHSSLERHTSLEEKARLEVENQKLRAEIEALPRGTKDQRSLHDQLKREKEALRAAFDDERECLETEIAELRARLDGTANESAAQNIQKLKADHDFALNKAVETERARHTEANKKLMREVVQGQRGLTEAREALDRALKEKKIIEGELALMDTRHADLQRRHTELVEYNDVLLHEKEELLKARKQAQKQEVGGLTERIEELEGRLVTVGKKLAEREQQVKEKAELVQKQAAQLLRLSEVIEQLNASVTFGKKERRAIINAATDTGYGPLDDWRRRAMAEHLKAQTAAEQRRKDSVVHHAEKLRLLAQIQELEARLAGAPTAQPAPAPDVRTLLGTAAMTLCIDSKANITSTCSSAPAPPRLDAAQQQQEQLRERDVRIAQLEAALFAAERRAAVDAAFFESERAALRAEIEVLALVRGEHEEEVEGTVKAEVD